MTMLFVLLGMFGGWEIIAIVLVLVVLFGGRKIPELMKGIGKGMKEFKNAVKDDSEDETENDKK